MTRTGVVEQIAFGDMEEKAWEWVARLATDEERDAASSLIALEQELLEYLRDSIVDRIASRLRIEDKVRVRELLEEHSAQVSEDRRRERGEDG